ncbi:hypothetical protein K501DRAFT_331709 [Backusella circina FSU 941]|nr:hypothetical protein K501DRAFT_331709 [Backusella circina FSU 941]
MPVNKKTGSVKQQSTAPKTLNNLAGAAILSAIATPIQPVGTGNGFNASEVVSFLNMRFSDTLTAYHDTNQSKRPEKYESAQHAWKNTLLEGQIANGKDFLLEVARCID